jgi:hypothetical protein
VSLKAEPDKLEVRKQAEDHMGEEDLKDAGEGNCKGGRETNIGSKATGQAI